MSAGRPSSELYAATVHVAGTAVADGDIERVLGAGSRHSVRDGRAVLHSMPIGYALDEARGIRDPRGMLGKRLGVDMHVVTIDVPAEILIPRNTWSDKAGYDATARKLAGLFRDNFEKYSDGASPEVRAAGPAAK